MDNTSTKSAKDQPSDAVAEFRRVYERAILIHERQWRSERIKAGIRASKERRAQRRAGGRAAAGKDKITVAYLRSGMGIRSQIQHQQAVCEVYANRLGTTIAHVYVDLGASGNQERRPMLDRLMRDLARGRIGRVVVAAPHVLARNQLLERRLEKRISDGGAALAMPGDYESVIHSERSANDTASS